MKKNIFFCSLHFISVRNLLWKTDKTLLSIKIYSDEYFKIKVNWIRKTQKKKMVSLNDFKATELILQRFNIRSTTLLYLEVIIWKQFKNTCQCCQF